MIALAAGSAGHEHAGGLAAHAVHVLPLLLVAVPVGRRLLRATPGWRSSDSDRHRGVLLAALLLAAATVHAVAARDHEGLAAGFFVATAGVQAALSVPVLSRRRPAVDLLVVGSSVGLVLLWAWSRTIGAPLGVEGGEVEAVGWPDLVAVAVELAAAALSCQALAGHRVPQPVRRVTGEHLAWGLIVVAGTALLT